jgi:hypothetical protein
MIALNVIHVANINRCGVGQYCLSLFRGKCGLRTRFEENVWASK